MGIKLVNFFEIDTRLLWARSGIDLTIRRGRELDWLFLPGEFPQKVLCLQVSSHCLQLSRHTKTRKTSQLQGFPGNKKSTRRDSNPRPSPWQGDAPPLSHSCISFLKDLFSFNVPSKPHIEIIFLPESTTRPSWISPRPISSSQLRTLLHFHLCPIYLVVFKGSYFFRMGYLILRGASRLDAFSVYPFQTWLPGHELSSSTGTPAVRPSRSSRTKDSSSQISYAHAG